MALWCAYLLTTPAGAIYHVGDTGYGDGDIFAGPARALRRAAARAPADRRLRAALVHAAAAHDPADAVKVLRTPGPRQALGHHWGTFRLTNEAVDAPPQALAAALQAAALPPERFRALRPGEVFGPI